MAAEGRRKAGENAITSRFVLWADCCADNKGAFLAEAKSSAYGDLGARAATRAS